MTLDEPNCRNWFWFLLLVRACYFRKYATDLREICRIASLMGINDCGEMKLRSLKGHYHGNWFSFIQSTQFFVTVTSVWQTLCSHQRRARRSKVVDQDDFCWQHHYTMELDISLPLRHFLDTRVWPDSTRSANAAWTHANEITDESTIINRRQRGGGWVGYSQALPCI